MSRPDPSVQFSVTRLPPGDPTHVIVRGWVPRRDGKTQGQVYRLAADADDAEIAAMKRAIEMELLEQVAAS